RSGRRTQKRTREAARIPIGEIRREAARPAIGETRAREAILASPATARELRTTPAEEVAMRTIVLIAAVTALALASNAANAKWKRAPHSPLCQPGQENCEPTCINHERRRS